MQDLIDELRYRLKDAVEKRQAGGILLSGGLDSSILASLSPTSKAFTITMEPDGQDLRYSKRLTQFLGLKLHHQMITVKEALDTIPTVIRILKTFDPAIPNDITIYLGLKLAKDKGIKEIMTGDGADELFAGYSYMWNIPDLEDYILRLKDMSFSSNLLAQELGIEIHQPFLDKDVVELSLRIPASLKVREEGKRRFGKWILRKAFESLLPNEIIWQEKRAIEYGSGTTRLRAIISSKISDEEFYAKQRLYPVRFMDREHLFYYEIYREVVGEIPPPRENQINCSGCGAGMNQDARHCRICGMVKNG